MMLTQGQIFQSDTVIDLTLQIDMKYRAVKFLGYGSS